MAVFGRDFYGLTKYGASVLTQYDVNPFDANPDGYGSLRVTWQSPAGTWSRLRLLRSRIGYAVDENDGTILVDATSSADSFTDKNLLGATWYYYTLFIQDGTGTWNRAGATSGLSVKKPWSHPVTQITGLSYNVTEQPYGHADLLWDRTPAYYKYVRRDHAAITDEYFLDPSNAALYNPEKYDRENQHLRALFGVLGWGLDYVHNYQETLLSASDPANAHVQDVDLLAQELGIDFEYGIPASVMRSKVANAALLARRRGTLDGIRDVASLSTGWDVDVEVVPNFFLNRDQSEFANPIFPEWDSGVNYAVGQKVQYEGRIFTATAGAYGTAQRPPETGTNSNTWWTVTTDTDVTNLRNPATNAVVTWKGFVDGSGTAPQTLSLAIGVSDPISSVGQESNALAVRNTSGAAHTYDVVGASNPVGVNGVLPQQAYAIRQGLPIPRRTVWDPTVEYDLGALVQHKGAAWRATGTSLDEEPVSGSIYWEKVGKDTRPVLAYSFYAHGPLSGTAGAGGVTLTPGMAFFDERGSLILDQVVAAPMSAFTFDTFNHTFGTPDYAPWGNWLVTGKWDTDSLVGSDNPVAYPLTSTGVALQTVPNTLTAYRVAATFAKAATTGYKDCLAIRYVDASNHMRLTRTAVEKVVSGTVSNVATLTTPIKDGDRVVVKMDDTANTFVVFVNGTQQASGALSGGTAPYEHGIMVES